MILNKAQVEAVYSAMCALNNMDGLIKVDFGTPHRDGIRVYQTDTGYVKVVRSLNFEVTKNEAYDSQAAFAAAYSLG